MYLEKYLSNTVIETTEQSRASKEVLVIRTNKNEILNRLYTPNFYFR